MKNFLTNWKTTLSGAALTLLVLSHFIWPQTITTNVVAGAGTVMTAAGLIAAKDGNVTGIGNTATTIEQVALPIVSDLTANSSNVTVQDIHKIIEVLKPQPITVNVGTTAPVTPHVNIPPLPNKV